MKFGPVPLDDAVGAILAHGQRVDGQTFKKGRILSRDDVTALRHAGYESVIAAQPETGDVHEDAAAQRLAKSMTGTGLSVDAPFTGRCNIVAEANGLFIADPEALNRINAIDEGITVATLAPYSDVMSGQMVATVKIIPFTVPGDLLDQAVAEGRSVPSLLSVRPYVLNQAGLVQTVLDGTKESTLDKTTEVLRQRLARYDCELNAERRVSHDASAVAEMLSELRERGADLLMIAGASAIVDRRDVVPAAIEEAGGFVDHFGMPVDPGNLLLLGRLGEIPVVGLPGCARSPKFNGLDMVLSRLAAGLAVSPADIMSLGAGGLLKEMTGRPQPRTGTADMVAARAPNVAAIVLAAGESRRMGARNKLIAKIGGKPMAALVVDAVLASRVSTIIVVTGHESANVREALGDRQVVFVENPDYAAGLSTSLKAGLDALPEDVDAALICLGDMPRLSEADIDRLIAAFDPVEGRAICVPTHRGKRGNPVLWGRRFFPEMMQLSGDVGARHLIGEHADLVVEVPMDSDSILLDIDSPEALESLTNST